MILLKVPTQHNLLFSQVSRELWTEGDRNMSQFFIYAFANFSWYGNPTPKTILGVHWDAVSKGEIQKYLAVNTTENSTTLWNYRQKECAFWTEYLPSVIGYITPTYPPTTEFWWEPESPLQVRNYYFKLRLSFNNFS